MTKTLVVFFLLPLALAAQTPRIDSLRAVLAASEDSLSQLHTLLALCDQKESLPGDSIYVYAERARQIARTINDQPQLLLANYYVLLSQVGKGEKQRDSVLAQDEAVLKTLQFDKEEDLYTKYTLQRARVLIRSARYAAAQAAIYDLLAKAEKSHNVICRIYGLTYIGWTYMEMEQLPVARSWFAKAEAVLDAAKPDLDYSPLYSNTAAVLDDMGRHDSAMVYVERSIDASTRAGDLTYLANAYAIQSDVFVHTGRPVDAEAAMTRAIGIREKIGDPFYIISDMGALAELYANDHKTAEGIRLCQQGIALARRYHYLPKELYLNEALAENYNAAGDYPHYAATLKTVIALKDSLYRNNSNQALADMQLRYESEKKDLTIVEQKYNLTKKNYLIYGITGLFLLTLAIGVIAFEIRRHRQALRLQARELETQQRHQQAIEETREEERNRILADLHDELGSGLSSIRIMSDLLAAQEQTQAIVPARANGHDQPPTPGAPNENGHLHPHERDRVVRYARRISDISRDTAQGMNTIIWALNNDHNNIHDLCEYIGRFGEGLFENTGIVFHLVTPTGLPDLQLSGAHRKNLFLCVKESLHNVLKHSGAHNAWVDITVMGPQLDIAITDDGRGLPDIEPRNAAEPLTTVDPRSTTVDPRSTTAAITPVTPNRFGNGLKNIMRRMHEIGGRVHLEKSRGLCVRLELPLNIERNL